MNQIDKSNEKEFYGHIIFHRNNGLKLDFNSNYRKTNIIITLAGLKSHFKFFFHKNDPSAGSPTETLLRLHLPLNDKIYTTSLPLSCLLQHKS